MTDEHNLTSTLDIMNRHLENISFDLSKIVAVVIPHFKPEVFGLTGEQKDVYEQCDGTLSADEITRELGKPGSQIRKSLARLKRKGLITSITWGRNAYYLRTNPQGYAIDYISKESQNE